MSSVVYNDVEIRNVLLENLEQETQYDEEGGIDPAYVRIHLRVKGIVRVVDPENSGADTLGLRLLHAGQDLGLSLKSVQEKLLQPRRPFTFYTNKADNHIWFHIVPAATMNPNRRDKAYTQREYVGNIPPVLQQHDVMNGPRTKLTVNRLVGTSSIHVTFEVIANILMCDSSSDPTANPLSRSNRPYIYLRYRAIDDFDENWYLTRAYIGRLRVFDRSHNPHDFKNFVLPPLDPGMVRREQRFEESADGLLLEFSIVDQQMHSLPPQPGITWQGNHVLALEDGMHLRSTMNLTIRGSPALAQSTLLDDEGEEVENPANAELVRTTGGSRDLLEILLELMFQKMNVAKALEEGNREDPTISSFMIDALSMEYSFEKNEVSGRISVLYEPAVSKNASVEPEEGEPLIALDNPFGADALWQLIDPGDQPLGLPPLLRGVQDTEILVRPKFPSISVASPLSAALQDACNPVDIIRYPTDDTFPELEEPSREADPDRSSKSEGAFNIAGSKLKSVNKNAGYRSTNTGLYVLYNLSSELICDTGAIRLPYSVADGEGNTTRAFQVHGGSAARVVRVIAERTGSHPKMPKPVTFTDEFDIEHTLIAHRIETAAPKLNVQGQVKNMTFHDEMTILYELSRCPTLEEIRAATLPYDTAELTKLKLPDDMFVDPGDETALH